MEEEKSTPLPVLHWFLCIRIIKSIRLSLLNKKRFQTWQKNIPLYRGSFRGISLRGVQFKNQKTGEKGRVVEERRKASRPEILLGVGIVLSEFPQKVEMAQIR